MKRIVLFVSILAMLSSCINISFSSKGKAIRCKGPVTEQSLDLKDFSSIVVNGSADMKLYQGDAFSVQVTANEEVFQYLDYRVEDGVLILATKDNVQIRAEKHELAVTLPCLESLQVNGAADVEIPDGYVSGKALNIVVNGAGDFDFESVAVPSVAFTLNGAGDIDANGLDVEKVSVTVNGAGDIVLAGRASEAFISVHGAGDVDATELACDKWETHRAGLASIKR